MNSPVAQWALDMWGKVSDYTVQLSRLAWGYAVAYPLAVAVAIGLIVMTFIALRFRNRHKRKDYRGRKMAKLTSKKIGLLLSDAVNDTIEDLVFKNQLSRKEANQVKCRLATMNFLSDLAPKKRFGQLKYEIRKRLGLLGKPLPKKPSKKTVTLTETTV